jgi:hypothetical protein
MREISAVLSDEIASKLEVLSKEIEVSKDTIIEDSLREYLSKLEQNKPEKVLKGNFNPVGFGMWKDREDMDDSAQWVKNLREKEWKR